ncbi:alpha/beta fold hydrolase [Tatumella sp. UBA2305]|uniref:alpha/beta fold hydrolase n=1 Tax=Tatumella sp. UBA2305 TaxID=1947647 RepID=UPI0025F17423|nr:alpha/beta hydrolase [Tatumella sp. UBA2305]
MTFIQPLPVVLLPGFMLDETLWDDYLKNVATGRSYLRLPLSPGETLQDIAVGYADRLPERFVIVGFSMGGYVARTVAAQYGERVAGMILIATSLRDDTPQQKQRKQEAVAATLSGSFQGLSPSAIRTSLHPDHASDPQLVQRIRAMGRTQGAQVFRTQSLLDRTDVPQADISCPVLVISARQDNLRLPEEASELAERFPQAESVGVEHSGHMIPLEQPAKLADITDHWLEKHRL